MEKPEKKYLKDYKRPIYEAPSVELTIELLDQEALVTSKIDVEKTESDTNTNPSFELDGQDLTLLSIELDGRPLSKERYTLSDTGLLLHNPPDRFTLTVKNRIVPHTNTSLEGFYKAGKSFLTQCEAEGFRRITYFPDRPDIMSVYTTTLCADRTRYPVLLSNGNLIDRGALSGNRHFATWRDPFKKPCYLFAMVFGEFTCVEDTYITGSGRKISIRFYVEPENADKCGHAITSLKQSMRWDEETFGLEYDLDTYMVVATHEFNMGAMENKGLNIFNAKYVLARQETATDMDFQRIEGVIAHEYFHNWTGNRVTVLNWFQLSLKEGLTVFRDQEFSADMGSRAIKRITDVRVLRAAQFSEDRGPMAHPVRPESYIEMNNFYTATVYNKGAEVIRMIHTLIGKRNFRKGMDLFFRRHDGQAVTIEAFLQAMETASGTDLAQFRLWYSQPGTPHLSMRRSYDPQQKTYTLTFSQHIPKAPKGTVPKPMTIPIRLALFAKTGKSIALSLVGEKESKRKRHERILSLEKTSEAFTFKGLDAEPIPSVLRGFSAPVTLHSDLTEDERIFLLVNDTDPFNRWDAAQELFTTHILALTCQVKERKPLRVSEPLIKALQKILQNRYLDKALIAQILSIPTETELGESMDIILVDELHEARTFFIQTISETLYEPFFRIYQALREQGPYAIDAVSMARRSLKNRALSFLGETERGAAIVFEAFSEAANMTDEIAALALIADMESEKTDLALQRFYEKWRHDPLVLDKWFSVQAGSKRSDTLTRVKALMNHDAFSLRNPNKVRSLLGIFSMENQYRFHAQDGSGYQLIADAIIELDPINPSISSRMASGFNKWKRFESGRRLKMREQLERIKKVQGISRGLFEIVTRAIEN